MNYLKTILIYTALFPLVVSSQEQEVSTAEQVGKTSKALSHTLSDESLPNPEALKIQAFQASYFGNTNTWRFTFRDEDKKYSVDTTGQGQIKLTKKFDEKRQNDDFWATLPQPAEVVKQVEPYVVKARKVVASFNPQFTLLERSFIKYKVCNPPKQDTSSKYDNGCKSNAQKEEWSVFVQIKTSIRGKEKKQYKVVSFRDGEPISLTNGSVY